MSTFLSVRRWERPDRPQPVYKGALSLWEAPFYVSIGDQSRNSWRVADRGQDRTYVQQTVTEPAWIAYVTVTPPSAAQIWPALQANRISFRCGSGPGLEVRDYDWFPESTGWIFSALPVSTTVAQQWPALHQASGLSYRSLERPRLDVRAYEWAPQDGWRQPVVDAIVRSWIPVFDAETSSRTAAAPALDVRRYEWAPQPAWIFSALPVSTTTAQQWPAVLEGLGLNYRSDERARLDVRRYEWAPEDGWRRPVVDAVVAKWISVFDAQVSFRSDDRPRLDVRQLTWTPEIAWLAPVLPAPVAAVAVSQVSAVGSYDSSISVDGAI